MDQPNSPPPTQPLPGAVPPHIHAKVGRNAIGCAVAVVIFFALILSVVLYAVAQTGIVHLPFFSRFYHGPNVTRRLQAPPLTESAFRDLLTKRLVQNLSAKTHSSSIPISELELTGALETTVTNALRGQGWNVRTMQMVIRPTDLEMTAVLDRGMFHADVLIRFTPKIAPDGLKFDPNYFQIGAYSLSSHFAIPLLSSVFDRDLGSWNISYGDFRLVRIVLHDGMMDMELQRTAMNVR